MKTILWLGVILLVGGGILVFLSGSQDANSQLIFPALNGLQMLWTVLAAVGLVLTIMGIVSAIAKRK